MSHFLKAFLLVISIGSAASAQYYPGQVRPAPYPGGGGGIVPGPSHPKHPAPPPVRPRPPRPSEPHYPPYPSNPYPTDPYPSNPYPPSPGYGDYEVKRIYLGRSVINEQLPLRSLAGLDYSRYSGWEIISVRARTRPLASGRPVAQLVVDGRILATQYDASYSISLWPTTPIVLDRNASQVRLAVSGAVMIDDIEVEVRRNSSYYPPTPNPGYGQQIDISVYRSVYGSDRIDLSNHIDLSRYRGYRIQQVIITARTNYGTGYISLLINSFNAGQVQVNGAYSQSQTIWLSQQPMIGQGADSLVLYTSGDMTIERVSLVVR